MHSKARQHTVDGVRQVTNNPANLLPLFAVPAEKEPKLIADYLSQLIQSFTDERSCHFRVYLEIPLAAQLQAVVRLD